MIKLLFKLKKYILEKVFKMSYLISYDVSYLGSDYTAYCFWKINKKGEKVLLQKILTDIK